MTIKLDHRIVYAITYKGKLGGENMYSCQNLTKYLKKICVLYTQFNASYVYQLYS